MGRNLMAQIAGYLSSQKRKKLGYWLLCSMGAVVVFCTTYALILPAITMSNDPICGLEAHVHDESCWTLETLAPEAELICEEWKEADIVLHTHTALCYNSAGELICPLEEREQHVHDESCYVEQLELICGKTAGEPEEDMDGIVPVSYTAPAAHTHTDACYSYQRGELVCPLEETEGHVHTDSCYITQPTGSYIQVCPYQEGEVVDIIFDMEGNPQEVYHNHNESCYEPEMEHILACGLEESEGHVHTDDCYAWDRVLTCPETEAPEIVETPEEPLPAVHVHTEECYQVNQIRICGEEEYILHTHGPECYETIVTGDGEALEILICELPVVIEHQHTEACLSQSGGEAEQVMVLTCGKEVHVHDDSCFLPAGPEPDPYYCGLAEHIHTANCYFASGELRCTIPEHIHTGECLDPENFTAPEYPMEEPGELEEPDDGLDEDGLPGLEGEEPGLPGGELDPDGVQDPSLLPVEVNDTYEVETDEFVMTFHVEGIAIPVLEEGETLGGSGVSDGWDITDSPLYQESIFGTVPWPETVPTPDSIPIPDTVGGPETMGDPEPDVTVDPEPAADPVPEEPDAAPDIPAEVPDAGAEDAPEEEAQRRGGRVLSMNLDSPAVPLAALPDESGFEAGVPEESGEDVSEPETVPPPPVEPEQTPTYQPPAYQEPAYQAPSYPAAQEPELAIEFHVEEVTEGEAYEELLAQVMELVDEDALIAPPQIMEITATYGGRKLDLAGCQITVQVQPTRALAEAVSNEGSGIMTLDEDGEEAAEDPGMALTIYPAGGEPVVKLFSGEEMAESGLLSPVSATFTARADGPVLYAATSTVVVNPRFTVQFHANLSVPESTGGTLPFIDTSSAGNGGKGAVLPKNGDLEPKIINLGLNDDGSIKFNTKPMKIYLDEEREFNPRLEDKQDINYINSLRDNGHYELKEVWVLKPGADADAFDQLSTAEQAVQRDAYWDVKSELNYTLTNNPELDGTPSADGAVYLAVDSSTVIRLVFDPLTDTYSVAATFYDFDISDGQNAAGNTATKIVTTNHGINSTLTVDASGQFAFGNKNAGTLFGETSWTNNGMVNRLNMTNKTNSYAGCTFGLVSGITSNGDVQFSSGVSGPQNTKGQPSLFGDGDTVKGRTVYTNWNMLFNRQGDTFTLSKVTTDNNDVVAANMEKFKNPQAKYPNIWTNNFWPMDKETNSNNDPMFGGSTAVASSSGNLPPSDDGVAHNSYFGMKYSIDFDLVKEYVGPLEYYFYGDDDMWVFLDGDLVCDIGGVHSSVGEYVDLWDYIPGGREDHALGKHTLSIFYTERGASGSTCWMQFTLPQISQIYREPYVPENTSLRISKEVKSVLESELNQEFRFSLQLSGLSNQYAMNFYVKSVDEDGNVVVDEDGNAVMVLDTERSGAVSNARVEFTLKSGEYVDVVDLPPGVHYVVEELYQADNCHTTVTGAETVTNDIRAEGSIIADQQTVVHYTNSFLYTLPETGGPGARMYTIGGMLLLAAGCLVYKKKTRRKGGVDSI